MRNICSPSTSTGEISIQSNLIQFVLYRAGQRHVNVVRDQRALWEKMEKANIPPPPLPETMKDNHEKEEVPKEETTTIEGKRNKVKEVPVSTACFVREISI